MAIETASGLIGFLDPLETLHEILTDDTQQAKLFDLSGEFGGWRRSKGDGSCFYRAVGFALIEAILIRNPRRLPNLAAELAAVAGPVAKDLINLLRELKNLETEAALQTFYQALLIDQAMDENLVTAMRSVAAEWLRRHQSADFSGMPVGVFVAETHGCSMETFLRDEVLAPGREAELLMIFGVVHALDVRVEVIQLDRQPGPLQRCKVPVQGSEEPVATLLFRPGHYDIFYRRDLYKEVAKYEEKLQLRRSCGQRGIAGGPSPSSRLSGGGQSSGSRQDSPRFGQGGSSSSTSRAPGGGQPRGAAHDSLEAAMDALSRAMRDSVGKCTAVIDREAQAVSKETIQLERDKAARDRLRQETDELRQEIAANKERLREQRALVRELRGIWACCCSGTTVEA